MTFQATTDAMTEGKPSMMKRRRHGAIGPSEANLTMSQARVEANVVARGAAIMVSWGFYNTNLYQDEDIPDMKIAVRNASSSRLKKKLK